MNDQNQNMRIGQDQMIAKVIGARYSIDEQIAILRQKDAKPEEYEEFYAFAEKVKADVKAEYAALPEAEGEGGGADNAE